MALSAAVCRAIRYAEWHFLCFPSVFCWFLVLVVPCSVAGGWFSVQLWGFGEIVGDFFVFCFAFLLHHPLPAFFLLSVLFLLFTFSCDGSSSLHLHFFLLSLSHFLSPLPRHYLLLFLLLSLSHCLPCPFCLALPLLSPSLPLFFVSPPTPFASSSSHRAVGAYRGGLGSDQLWYEGGREKPDWPGQVLWPLLLW